MEAIEESPDYPHKVHLANELIAKIAEKPATVRPQGTCKQRTNRLGLEVGCVRPKMCLVQGRLHSWG